MALAVLSTIPAFALSGCGKGAPDKGEVKQFMIDQSIQQNGFGISSARKQAIQAQEEKAVDVQGLQCTPTPGFKSVWDCSVSMMLNGNPQTAKFRFSRDNNGNLHGQEQDQ